MDVSCVLSLKGMFNQFTKQEIFRLRFSGELPFNTRGYVETFVKTFGLGLGSLALS